MSQIIARIGISLVSKLITEIFLSKLIIESLRIWARGTENKYDDLVVQAMAEALRDTKLAEVPVSEVD